MHVQRWTVRCTQGVLRPLIWTWLSDVKYMFTQQLTLAMVSFSVGFIIPRDVTLTSPFPPPPTTLHNHGSSKLLHCPELIVPGILLLLYTGHLRRMHRYGSAMLLICSLLGRSSKFTAIQLILGSPYFNLSLSLSLSSAYPTCSSCTYLNVASFILWSKGYFKLERFMGVPARGQPAGGGGHHQCFPSPVNKWRDPAVVRLSL